MITRILGTREFTGWHMIGVLALFFGTIISVNLTMAWFATHSWTGLVVKNSYVASQEFNERTAERQRELALGWAGQVEYGDATFSIALKDGKGEPLSGAIVTALIGRPAFDAEDRTVTLDVSGRGIYSTDMDLATGIWSAKVQVTGAAGEIWNREYRFIVKDE